MTAKTNPSPRRRKPHAQLHLPVLTAEQALLLVNVLERVITAIYRAHGDAMAQLSAARIDPPLFFSGSLPDDFPF
jgi:hypothetical protein